MQRRDFLRQTSKLALTTAIAPRAAELGRTSINARDVDDRVSAFQPPFLDAHAHSQSAALGVYQVLSGFARTPKPPVDGAAIIATMNANGVQRAYVLSTAYQMAVDARNAKRSDASVEYARVRLDNDFTATECARYPDRLVPFLSVNPKRGYAVDEVDRCAEQKMRGLKLHLWNSLVDTRQPQDLAALKRVVERAARHGLPVVAHILVGDVANYGADDTERFVREVIMPFDTLKISIAHLAGAGGFDAQVQLCFERLIKLCGPTSPFSSRVWVDMAAILISRNDPSDVQRLGELLPQWGLDRVLWGSDNLADAMDQTRSKWPLDAAAWKTIADQRGSAFIA